MLTAAGRARPNTQRSRTVAPVRPSAIHFNSSDITDTTATLQAQFLRRNGVSAGCLSAVAAILFSGGRA